MVPSMFLLSLNSCESSYEIMGGDYQATDGGWHELDLTPSARCWVCWTHEGQDWYAAYVSGPQFRTAWRAMVDEVAK